MQKTEKNLSIIGLFASRHRIRAKFKKLKELASF
jgi:hypothetical protein